MIARATRVMHRRSGRSLVRLVASAAAVASPMTLAGGSTGGVVLGPVSATAVPTLTPAIMIALGGMLAVIGLRVLRQHGGAQKVVSVALLAGGALVGGFGVDRTLATGAVPLSNADCDAATITVNYQRNVTDQQNAVSNQCGRDLQVKEYPFSCPELSVFIDNGAPVGTVIPDGAEQTVGYCSGVG